MQTSSAAEDHEPERSFLRRAFDRFYQWFFLVREYEVFGALYGQDTAVYMWFCKQVHIFDFVLTFCRCFWHSLFVLFLD
jgi:hypothetical protein